MMARSPNFLRLAARLARENRCGAFVDGIGRSKDEDDYVA